MSARAVSKAGPRSPHSEVLCLSQRQEMGGVQIAPHTDAPHPPGSTLQPTLETTPIPFRRRAGGKVVADSCSGTLLGEENKSSYSPM